MFFLNDIALQKVALSLFSSCKKGFYKNVEPTLDSKRSAAYANAPCVAVADP